MSAPRISARVRANRLNALKSTGPKTRAGKVRVSRNALVHGLASCQLERQSSELIEQMTLLLVGAVSDENIIAAARKVAEAQYDLIRVRMARLEIWKKMSKCEPVFTPNPALLKDPVIDEFLEYMTTHNLDAEFGPKAAQDFALMRSFLRYTVKMDGRHLDSL